MSARSALPIDFLSSLFLRKIPFSALQNKSAIYLHAGAGPLQAETSESSRYEQNIARQPQKSCLMSGKVWKEGRWLSNEALLMPACEVSKLYNHTDCPPQSYHKA